MDFRGTALLTLTLLGSAAFANSREAAPAGIEIGAAGTVAAPAAEAHAPAWRAPGFVMDEIVATAVPVDVEYEVRAPEAIEIDLEALMRLHRSVPRLNR